MRLYHRTYWAATILREGFRDMAGFYMTPMEWSGVWFSDMPLDENEGADGDVVFSVDIPEELLAFYEWIEEDKPYREWLIPATLANEYGPPVVLGANDVEEITTAITRVWHGLA